MCVEFIKQQDLTLKLFTDIKEHGALERTVKASPRFRRKLSLENRILCLTQPHGNPRHKTFEPVHPSAVCMTM